MRQLLAKAAHYGVHVHYAHLRHGIRGFYDHDEQRIYLSLRLAHFERRSTLAHELGHAHYGHDCTTPRNERQARAYAARLLIDPEEYARLERINPDQHHLAEEFSVTPRIIFDFEQFCLTPLRGVTYATARHGFGQWAHMALRPQEAI